MSLRPGARLGPYEVVSALGAGGMGEVWRARDPRLGRDVALKTLPAAFVAAPERLARFEREAKLLASLNHPHIGGIYGLEEADGGAIRALVLELVDGPTLADRIALGPIPVDDALPIARQIAEALEAAHEQGIVHRDLKPANIKVRPDGAVKVLDFGLAKALETPVPAAAAAGEADLSHSPTLSLSAAATQMGMILGTAAYMAPEQARGRPVDKRADIWAFGCVLYEMLAGRRAFAGSDVTDTMAAVLRSEPDWAALPPGVPAAVTRLLRRCLEKDPRRRLRDIGDATPDLANLDSRSPELAGAESARRVESRWRPLWTGAALTAALLAGFTAAKLTRSAPAASSPPQPSIQSDVLLESDAPLALDFRAAAIGYDSPVVAIARDGRRLAYVAGTAAGTVLRLREMSTGRVEVIPGTEGAVHAAFSPDGASIAFLTGDRVKRVGLAGGGVTTLCEARLPILIWWPTAVDIYFTEDETWQVSRVRSNGPDRSELVLRGDGQLSFSDVLPDGSAAIASSRRSVGGDFDDIVLVELPSGEETVLISSGYGARFAPPGHLLFGRAGNLMAVRFDAEARTVEGEPAVLVADVAMDSLFRQVHAASSETGLLASAVGGDLAIARLAWVERVDRGSRVEYLPDEPRLYGALDLSPDGSRIAVHVGDVLDYVWVSEIGGRSYRMQSSSPLGWPLWSPDGRRMAAVTLRRGESAAGYVVREPESTAREERVNPLRSWTGGPNSWSPVADVLAIPQFQGTWETSIHPIGEAASTSPFAGVFPKFSPDGRYVAYQSSDTTTSHIYIRSHPEGRVSQPFSLDGGTEPLWNPGTGELFYRKGRTWYATEVTTSPELRWGEVRRVFDTEFVDTPGMSYDVSPDGRRLLVVKRHEPVVNDHLRLLTDWPASLARR